MKVHKYTAIILICGCISLAIGLSVYIPYYKLEYEPSQAKKNMLQTSTCIVTNQTINFYNACSLRNIACGCSFRDYYPCDALVKNKVEGYCCDTECPRKSCSCTNLSQNVLNYNNCGENQEIITVIRNLQNISNTFIINCEFDDNMCINKWIGYKKNVFECYYYSNTNSTIILDKPSFIELDSIGFIFAYIFIGCAMFSIILAVVMNFYNLQNNIDDHIIRQRILNKNTYYNNSYDTI